MSKEEELAYALFNAGRLEENSGGVGTTTTMYGDAVSDSSDGYVKVTLDGDVSAAYADGSVGSNVLNLPTVPNVVKGDKVIIQCVGTTAKTMTVIGVVGSGDRTQGAAGKAASDAATAQAEANKAQQEAEKAQAKAELEQQRTNCNNDMYQTGAKNIVDVMGNQGGLKASTGQLIFTASSTQPTASHTGDLWLDTASSKAYKWDGSAWVALDGDTAKDDTAKLVSAANVEGSPFKVFTVQPTTPYKVGDLYLTDIEKGDIYRCIKARESGDYSADDWSVTSSYDSAMSQLMRALDAGKASLETKAAELKAQADKAYAEADALGQVATNNYQVEYIQTDSATTAPSQDDTGWSKTAPARTAGKYIWMRSTYYIGTGDHAQLTHSEPSCVTGDAGPRGLQGLQGEKGDQGIQGPAGSDGKTTYFHIKYSAVAEPTSSSQMTETPSAYIGTYVDSTEADSTEPSKYTWARFQGLQGEKGDQGIPGVGTDGKTSYLHIKYSNDGGKTFTGNSGEDAGDYIGTCTDFNVADPSTVSSYKWAKIKGDAGTNGTNGTNGVSVTASDTFYRFATTQPATPTGAADPSGWSKTEPTPADTYTGNEYRCIRTTLSNGTALWTTPTVVASFSFAQKAYSTASGAVAKYSSTKDTVDSWVKSFGEDFSAITGEGWKAGTTLAQTANDITLKADSSYVEQVGVGGRNLLRYTNRYDFTGEYDAPTFGLSTTGTATTLRTAYLDGETYYLSPRDVYTGWAESRFVAGTDSWGGDYTGYGWAVGDKVLWRFKASDTGKCMYQVLTITGITSLKVNGTITFSDMAGATWGWQVRVTKAPSSWHYFYAYDSYGTMKGICDDGAEYYTVSCRMKASVATSDNPLQNLVIMNGDASSQAYSHVDSTGQLTAGKWCFVSGTVKRIEGASYSSQVIYFRPPALAAAGVTLEVKDLKIERGRQATDWTSAPEDGDLVTSAQIKVESDSILSTVSDKYATKDGSGTKESDVRQLSDSVTTQFTSLKGAITEWVADPDFKQGAANVDSWRYVPATSGMTQSSRDNVAGGLSDRRQLSKGTIIRCEATVNCASMADNCTPNVIMFASSTADGDNSYWPTVATGTKGSKTEQKLFGYYTVPDAYDGWWFRVGTQIAAETTSGATGSVTWTHVRVTDVTSATEDSTLIHQTSDGVAVGKGTQAADGKVTWTSGQFHTLQGNGTFQVLGSDGKTAYTTIGAGTATIGNVNKPHTTIASSGMTVYGGDNGGTQYLSATSAGLTAGNPSGYHVTANESGFQMLTGSTVWSSLQANSVSLASGRMRVGIASDGYCELYTNGFARIKNSSTATTSGRTEMNFYPAGCSIYHYGSDNKTLDAQFGVASDSVFLFPKSGGRVVVGGLNITGTKDSATNSISYANLVKMLNMTSGSGTITDQISSGQVYWMRRGCVVTGYVYLTVKYYQSTWAESPNWATGLPANNSQSSNCGTFYHDCNGGVSQLRVTTSGQLRCYRRTSTITAGTVVWGNFTYITDAS